MELELLSEQGNFVLSAMFGDSIKGQDCLLFPFHQEIVCAIVDLNLQIKKRLSI